MNKIVFLLGVLILVGCGPYQKALNSSDNNLKVKMIDQLFEEGKYGKSITLFEQIIPAYRGTDSAVAMSLKYARALYEDELYGRSAGQYERFVSSYPTNESKEKAVFFAAKSHYHMSPIYSKDQEETDIALVKLQDYINTYPNGGYIDAANMLVAELRDKLDEKAYRIAKQYHHRGGLQIKAAIQSLKNFIVEHPGSQYQDDAHYYLLESQYTYAANSFTQLIPERMEEANKYYDNFARRFPQSEYMEEAQKIKANIDESMTRITSIK